MRLEGKNAVVTGGNRGIGRAISLALATKGANVAVFFHAQKQDAELTCNKIKNLGVKSVLFQVDVSDISQVRAGMESVKNSLGGIDILVNNAGFAGPHWKLDEICDSEWRKVLDINLTGAFYCCQAAETELRKNRGKIVNVSSIAGKMGGTIGCHYGAAKAGVIGLTFALAGELAPDVTVNGVAPGPVDTDFISEEIKAKLSARTPFGRIAQPEEIAHAVIFLLENDYVSGEIVDINAGRHMD